MRPLKKALVSPQLLLTLIILSSQCLCFYLPASESLTKRVEVPAIDNADFIDHILNSVNHHRGQQDAHNLTWSSALALEAFNWANEYDFNTSVSTRCTIAMIHPKRNSSDAGLT